MAHKLCILLSQSLPIMPVSSSPPTLPECKSRRSKVVSLGRVHVSCSRLHMRADAPQRQQQHVATKPVRRSERSDKRAE
jgi:hypothetical protein